MGKTRPPYPAQFREQMVELVRSGRTPAAKRAATRRTAGVDSPRLGKPLRP